MQPIEAALAALKSLKPGEIPDFTATAKKYGVQRSTLSRRYHGVTGSREAQYENQQLLSHAQEKVLVDYINELTERGLPPSHEMIRNFAEEICGKEPGKNWPSRFVERHNTKICTGWTTSQDQCRHRADPAAKYALYFELLKREFEKYDIDPRHVYNMDEKGFLIGLLKRMRRIFSKRKYDKGLRKYIQDGSREWITLIACICADGSALSPLLIYKAVSGKVQSSWLEGYDPQKHSCFFASSPKGWTNADLGYRWLVRIFNEGTKAKARSSYRVLIVDGHGSHISLKFINFC